MAKSIESLYGQYAPHGDCKREPRITVNDSGFAFEVDGGITHTRMIESLSSPTPAPATQQP